MGCGFLVPPLQYLFQGPSQLQKCAGPTTTAVLTVSVWFPLAVPGKQNRIVVEFCFDLAQVQMRQGHFFLVEHPEDLGICTDSRPGSIWQWPQTTALLAAGASTFAVHQCCYGSSSLKPARFLCNFDSLDFAVFHGLPLFDAAGHYLGPLPRTCLQHPGSRSLKGTDPNTGKWATAAAASYPGDLCKFLATIALSAWRRGISEPAKAWLSQERGASVETPGWDPDPLAKSCLDEMTAGSKPQPVEVKAERGESSWKSGAPGPP